MATTASRHVTTDPLRWLRSHTTPDGAIAVSARNPRPYPEVTGYLIPNLLAHGELALARRYGAFLCAVQRPDGAFPGPDDGAGYAFDTGQALRGLLALADDPQCAAAARRAADWLCRTAGADGRLLVPDLAAWDLGPRGRIPEAVHLYALPPLLVAGARFGERRYRDAALRARDAYLRDREALRFPRPNMLSHFFGYVHEALIDLGAAEVAAAAVAEQLRFVRADGMVPAYHDVDWCCLPGQLQAAIVLAKLGARAEAAAVLAFAERQQRPNGGFPGSVGAAAAYFPDDEPGWAVKFWLDAVALRDARPPAAVLDRNLDPAEWHRSIGGGQSAAELAERVARGAPPAWLPALLAAVPEGATCLELGSGTGELSAHLARAGRKPHLLDFSPESLALADDLFRRLSLAGTFVQADVTGALPFPDHSVDVVWSSGLLEHFEPPQLAHILRESARVAARQVVALVPNKKSLPYRLGKAQQERDGTWTWGREEPFATLRPAFAAAGLVDVVETTVAPQHALQFLTAPELQPMRQALERWFATLTAAELAELDQGYLLVTIGQVPAVAREVPVPAVAGPEPLAMPPAAAVRQPRRLVVVPNDPLDAYPAAGYPDLTSYFNPDGVFPEVICLSPHEPRRRRMYGMQVEPITAETFAARVRELGADVVRAYCLPSGQFACRDKVPGVHYVVSVHDTDPERCPGALPAADRFLAVSAHVADFLRSKGAAPARLQRLPNRVDLEVFRPVDDPVAKARWQARFPGRYRVLHVGRRSPQKNLETLIRALGQLGPDWCGVFVGRGDAAPYSAVAAAAGANVHFVDMVPNQELPAWYSFADAMCTPSRYEGFGVVFVEALAAGALVITSAIAPMDEFVVDGVNGLLVERFEDPDAIAAALRRGVLDRELHARLRAAAPAAAVPFGKPAVDRLEAGIYREIVAALPATPAAESPRPPAVRVGGLANTNLPGDVKLRLRAPEHRQVWDALVTGSPDAGMFHRFDWQDCQLAAFPLQDLSFLVERAGRVVAVCPLQRYKHAPEVLHGTFMGTGGPALLGTLSEPERAELQEIVHGMLRRFLEQGVGRELRMQLPQLAVSSRAHWSSQVNPLVAHGYQRRETQTAIVQLDLGEAALFDGLRRRTRQAVRRAAGLPLRVEPLRGPQGVDAYYTLHVETYTRTGVPPHPRAYFEAIGEFMVERGHAEMLGLWHEERLIAAANFARFADTQAYWTGAYAQEALDLDLGRVLQWEAIRRGAADGRRWHETGEVFRAAVPGSKEAGLTGYKMSFGGIVRPWWKGALRSEDLQA